jgi:hypothetical protein
LSARATVVVQVLIFVAVLFAWALGGVARRIRPTSSWAVVAIAGFGLSLLGNWMHVSFLFLAAAIAVMWALAWWSTPGIGTVVRIGLFASGSLGLLLGCVFSPYGIALTLERSRVVDSVARGLVSEWMSVVDFIGHGEVQVIPIIGIALAAAVGVVFWLVRLLRRDGRFESRTRIVLPLSVLSVLAIGAGLGTVRFLTIGLLAILPVVGAAATDLVDVLRRRQRTSTGFWSRPNVARYTSGRFVTAIIIIIGLVASPFAVSRIALGAEPAEAAIARRIPHGCLVWAKIGAAGPIILTRPDTKVWIDGRVDFYGRNRVTEYVRIVSGTDPLPEQTGCVVLPSPSRESYPISLLLDGDSRWSRAAEVKGFVLWVRQD